MITSLSNARVREIIQLEKKKKCRYSSLSFVSEGIRMVLETPGELLEELYISESFYRNPGHMEKLSAYFSDRADLSNLRNLDQMQIDQCSLVLVSDEVMQKMADTEHPQGILSVTAMPSYSIEDLFSCDHPMFLLPEDIQDPGNLGTMFRTAEGAGANGLILGPGCTDPFQPKVVRSTMGSLFRMPFIAIQSEENWYELLLNLKKRGVRLFAAWLPGSVSYDDADYRGSTGFLIGNEGRGLKEKTAEISDQKIRIPMEGKLESLNAAMSAGILMYEAKRQRRGLYENLV